MAINAKAKPVSPYTNPAIIAPRIKSSQVIKIRILEKFVVFKIWLEKPSRSLAVFMRI